MIIKSINFFALAFIVETLILFLGLIKISWGSMSFYLITFLGAILYFGWGLVEDKKR